MADAGPHDETAGKNDPEIGAAEWLFREEAPGRSPRPSGTAVPRADEVEGEVFDLADGPEEAAEVVPPVAPPIPAQRAQSGERTPSSPRDSAHPAGSRARQATTLEPEDAVDVVWSRAAEWGPNLVAVAACLATVGVLVYLLMGMGLYGMAFLLLIVGLGAALVLSYPMLITLERPVRMTPEQAVKDFYNALSHHQPHYRRMWLLLARTGRTNSSYGSYEGFKAYWAEKIKTIKGNRAGAMTPLVFEVEEYRGEKSGGKSRVDVKFTLKVSVRGQRQAGPVASLPGQMSLVRGPDNMWYLESGTLPQPPRRAQSD